MQYNILLRYAIYIYVSEGYKDLTCNGKKVVQMLTDILRTIKEFLT